MALNQPLLAASSDSRGILPLAAALPHGGRSWLPASQVKSGSLRLLTGRPAPPPEEAHDASQRPSRLPPAALHECKTDTCIFVIVCGCRNNAAQCFVLAARWSRPGAGTRKLEKEECCLEKSSAPLWSNAGAKQLEQPAAPHCGFLKMTRFVRYLF